MAHVERQQIFEWLESQGYRAVTAEDLRRILAARA
jgi:hypothetical protein